MPLYLGIDFGTSNFKVGLFGESGTLRGLARLKVEATPPGGARSELSTERFWSMLRRGVMLALREARARPEDIAGISYSSQANTFVLLDERDQPLTPLILWTDARAPQSPHLASFSNSPEFASTTGFSGIGALWAVNKLGWLQTHEPEIWRRTRHIKSLSDYFTFSLTGHHVGDSSTASLLGLYDLRRGAWWDEALAATGIDSAHLSRPLPPGTAVGVTLKASCGLLGLPQTIPFCVGGLDHQVAALGSGIGWKADASISTGTVLAALCVVTEPTPQNDCYHGPWFRPGEYFRLAFDPNGAGQLEDLRTALGTQVSIGDMIDAALPEYSDSINRTMLPTAATDRIRAVLESIAQAHLRLLQRIDSGHSIRRLVATGGGARSHSWLRAESAILQIPIMMTRCSERACLGAALMAAYGAAHFGSLDQAVAAMVACDDACQPRH